MRQRILAIALGGSLALMLGLATVAVANNGSSTNMPAYYDCELHTVNFTQVSLDVSHSQINTIYEFPQCTGFIPVIDQITGGENTNPPPKNGFNPLWQLVQVYFTGACPTSQIDSGFCSDNGVAATGAACGAPAGGIMLVCTGKVFRCSVVGQKSPNGP
jgi:hypothetical protein